MGGGGLEKSLTVSDYSRQFFERTVNKAYAEDAEENQKLANTNFVNLIRKLQEAGSKDDIKVPLRVLRDEIGRIYFGSSKQRSEKIECLFKLYDALEAAAQEDLRSKDGKAAAAASHTLDELRQRFSRLVIGDTWEAWPELKLLALKRMHAYALKEGTALKAAAVASPPPTPSSGGRLGMRKLSRTFSGAAGGGGGPQWQAAIDELGKAPGSRLLPLIKLLLLDSVDLPQEAKEGLAAEAAAGSNGVAAKDVLKSQPSDVSEATRRVAELNMDDLLGLSDITEEEGPAAPQQPAQDPFKVQVSGAQNGGPQQQQQQQQQPQQQYPQRSGELHSQGSYGQPAPQLQPLPYPYQQQPNGRSSGDGGFGGGLSPRGSSGYPLSPPAHYSQPGQQPQGVQAFERNAFGSQTAFQPGAPQQQVPGSGGYPHIGQSGQQAAGGQPGGFNPFGLPSPTYASAVPPGADNNFAAFSPVAAAPPQPVPQPMRAPPQPPVGAPHAQQQWPPQQQQQQTHAGW